MNPAVIARKTHSFKPRFIIYICWLWISGSLNKTHFTISLKSEVTTLIKHSSYKDKVWIVPNDLGKTSWMRIFQCFYSLQTFSFDLFNYLHLEHIKSHSLRHRFPFPYQQCIFALSANAHTIGNWWKLHPAYCLQCILNIGNTKIGQNTSCFFWNVYLRW